MASSMGATSSANSTRPSPWARVGSSHTWLSFASPRGVSGAGSVGSGAAVEGRTEAAPHDTSKNEIEREVARMASDTPRRLAAHATSRAPAILARPCAALRSPR